MPNESYVDVQCPLCSQLHRYGLTVNRTTVLSMASGREGAMRNRRFFHCPVKDQALKGVLDTQSECGTLLTDIAYSASDNTLGPDAAPRPSVVPVRIMKGIEMSPHNRALLDAGRAMLNGSIEVAREFSKHMITVSISAIPVYLSVLGFLRPDRTRTVPKFQPLTVAPIACFLLAFFAFTTAFMPKTSQFSLDVPGEIELEREKIIRRRRILISIGQILFATGIVVAVIMLVLEGR